ncbi:MAG: pilus assembly PilX N-terminal domain-containing protein [Dehalococcoidia bacterium]
MKLLKRMMRNQAGQALAMALILLVMGSFLIVALLDLTTINLKATKSVDLHTRELYAADAGVEDALWYLQSEARLKIKNPPDGQLPLDYPFDNPVNDKAVEVKVESAWLLSNYPGLPATEPLVGEFRYANDHWTTIGALNIDVQPRKNYIVDITTNEAASTTLDHIGVWLPQGYKYNGNVKINDVSIGGTGDPQHLVKNPDAPVPYRGGNVYKWNYLGTTFKSLSDIASPPLGGGVTPSQKFPPSVRLSFDYTNDPIVTPFKEAKGFFPWIMLSSGKISWDADAGFYHVTSVGTTPETGTSTTVEAYVPKGVTRYLSGSSGAASAIQGDYIAIGNSLMTCCWNQAKNNPGPPCNSSACTTCCQNNPYRNYAPAPVTFTGSSYTDAERESSATVKSSGADAVPSDAKIERAYLYWTAWLRGDKVWLESPTLPGHGTGSWTWTNIMGADATWEANAPQYVKDWLALNAYDGKAYLAVSLNGVDVKVTPVNAGDPLGTVVADTWYISEGSNNVQPSYQYSCFADVTAQVLAAKPDHLLSNTKFTVAGVHAHPSPPNQLCNTPISPLTLDWSRSPNAGWSMIIIYSSPSKKTHQIYLYRGCQHLFQQPPIEFTMTGFAAPLASDLLPGENNEAKMTVFASEGDVNSPPAEYLGFKGQTTGYYQLYDVSGTADVFNSRSSSGGFTPSNISTCGVTGEISGIDIDTYTYTIATEPPSGTPLYNIVKPGDTSASIKVESPTNNGEGFEVIYVVFSVRSTAVPAGEEFNVGSMLYRIE